MRVHITEKTISTDALIKSGTLKRIENPSFENFTEINTPCPGTVDEMREVMKEFYNGTITKEDIKEFFVEYCGALYARKEETILNVYKYFLNQSYEEAVY